MINKTSGCHKSVFDLRHFICVLNMLHASIFVKEEDCGFVCEWVCICVLMDLWGHARCVRLYGMSEPTVVRGSIDRRLRATHVKFMYRAAPALTKAPPEWFLGEDYAGESGGWNLKKKQDRRANDMKEERWICLLGERKIRERDPSGQSKGLNEAKVKPPTLLAIPSSPREIERPCATRHEPHYKLTFLTLQTEQKHEAINPSSCSLLPGLKTHSTQDYVSGCGAVL